MTQEEFRKRMKALLDKETAIRKEKDNLQNEYLASYPIQPGDKCVDESGSLCWLNRTVFLGYRNTRPYYLINYPKTDGTRSKREKYYFGKLTKVE